MANDKTNILSGKFCEYCQSETIIVSGETIYPQYTKEKPRPKYLYKKYYVCKVNPDHYVGTYADNMTSLGRVADKALRTLKSKGHNIFDPLWKTKVYFKTQKQAYKWLSEKMKLPLELTHFGMFTDIQCKDAIQHCMDLTHEKK